MLYTPIGLLAMLLSLGSLLAALACALLGVAGWPLTLLLLGLAFAIAAYVFLGVLG